MKSEQYSCTQCKNCGEIQFNGDMKHFSAVKCSVCGKFHALYSNTFVSVYGEIRRGVKEGIVGPNIENDMVTKTSIFCVGECFKKVCAPVLTKDFDDFLIEDDDPQSLIPPHDKE